MTAGPPSEAERDDDGAAALRTELKALILENPGLVLNDAEIMRALLAPQDRVDRKIIDLRGAALDRLERRMTRLTAAHRDMVDAAFDNMTGMEQAHGAALLMLEARGVEDLAIRIRDALPALLGVDAARLCLAADEIGEASQPAPRRRRGLRAFFSRRPTETRLRRAGLAAPVDLDGLADTALVRLSAESLIARAPRPRRRRMDRGDTADLAASIVMREPEASDRLFFGEALTPLNAVAVVGLDLGSRRAPGVLAFGSEDPLRFRAGASVELLSFIGGVAERLVRAEARPADPAAPAAGRLRRI